MKYSQYILLMAFAAFFTSSAWAFNPQMMACHTTGGNFYTLDTENDHIGFCQYGQAMIDSVSILNRSSRSLAIKAIEQTANSSVSDCESAGASDVSMTDSDNQTSVSICQFDDSSSIELQTIVNGINSPSNAGLKRALK